MNFEWYERIHDENTKLHENFIEFLEAKRKSIQTVLEVGCGTGVYPIKYSKLFNDELTWASVEITYNFKQDHRFSLSYGSKRGGVYCSNGICRYMQPFENGFIFKIISSF